GGFDHRQAEGGEGGGDAGVRRPAQHAQRRPGARLPRRGLPRARLQPVLGRRRRRFGQLPRPQPDAALGALAAAPRPPPRPARGLLDSTVVIVMGEFGRTPRLNKGGVPGADPIPGRDHWGEVMSVLVAGGGFAGGRVIGSSNSRGEVPRDRPVTPADLLVTLYR